MRWMTLVEQRTVRTWVLVIAIAALSLAGVGLESPWAGSDAGLALTSVLLAGPLLLRVTRPLLTACLVAVALIVQMELGGSLHFASFITVLIAAYSVGWGAAGRRTLAGIVVLLVGVVVAMRHSLPQDADELVFPLFYVTAAAALGSVVRRQVRQAGELRRLNEALVREREAVSRLAVATERLRLARELHDVVAHTLTVSVIQAEACESALEDADPVRAREAARRIQSAGRRGLADLRSLVGVLRADASAGDPVLDDLDALGAVMSGAGLEVTVLREGERRGIPADLQCELYRIVQEALTNVVKHSAATSARIGVRSSGSDVEVVVHDPGPALESEVPSGGHGVAGMVERIAPFGGHVVAGPDGDGFRVQVNVPVTGPVQEVSPGQEVPA